MGPALARAAGGAAPAASRSRGEAAAAAPAFTINGRFYGQPVTGVQRYGREIVAALDALLAAGGRRAALRMPRGPEPAPFFEAIAVSRPGPGRGHGWEQARLPVGHPGPLLNLCNTGPLALHRQVVCIHDANIFAEPGSYRASFRLAYRALQPLLARRAAVVATVSRASADALAARFGLARRHIAVLPNGHEHARAWAPDDTVLTRHGLVRPFVLALGSRARHKNLDLLLRLAPALDVRGLDLVVAGGGGSVFADTAAARGSNVRCLGSVSDGELGGLLARARCLAFPSWTEGFGLPIVEAMAHGCPVVASNRASMPEVCGNAALMAAPDDPPAWLSHIGRLAGSAQLRRELAERGAAQVRRFSWRRSAQGYLDLLESLA